MSSTGETVERFIAAFNEGDLDGFEETLHPEVEIHSARGGVLVGPAEARIWATRAPGGVQQRIVIEDLVENGDLVVALTRRQWHWDGTDELADEQQMAHVFTLRDGRVVRWQPFEDRAEAMLAAGVTG